MKILVINGSHRNGNTTKFVGCVTTLLQDQGHSVNVLNLLTNRFEICDGCLACEETGVCVLNDYFTNIVAPKLMEADAYVFAMPVYFNSVPALFKNFIDRTNCLCGYFEENPKKLGVFLVGQLEEAEGSFESVLRYLGEYADIMNFELAEETICVTAREPGEIEIDENVKSAIATWFK